MRLKFKWIFTLLIALSVQFSFAQEKTVSGVVSDATGPIPGVNVVVKGTNRSVQTDFDGKYALKASVGEVLVFSFIGMNSSSVTVGASNNVNVKLTSSSQALEEVVVVAYGTAKKTSITGSVSNIKSEDIEKRPIANLSSAIEGSTAGVLVTAPSGQPGSGQSIRIRGFGSAGGTSNDALYVVDGFPISGNLSSINPNDIESISILKDAGSTALYGNKAANGVVIVTTKKGKAQGGEFKASMSTGIVSRGTKEYDRLGPSDYYEAFWESRRNAVAIPGVATPAAVAAASLSATNGIFGNLNYNPFNVPNNQIVGVDGKINPNATLLYPDDLDWEKAISRTGIRRNADVSFQNKSEKGSFYGSIGYLSEDGYILNSDFTRVTARLNSDYQATTWLKVGLNIAGNISEGNQAQVGGSSSFVNPFRFTRGMGSIYPVHAHDASGAYVLDENGQKVFDLNGIRTNNSSTGRHIVAEILWNKDLEQYNNLNTRAFFDVKIAKGLVFTNNMSYEVQNRYNSSYRNPLVGDGASAGADATKTYTKRATTGFNQLLNYSTSIADIHNFGLLAGHETQKFEIDNLTGSRKGEIFSGIDELGNFVTTTNLFSQFDAQNEESYFGRFNYNYNDKYFLSLSGRRDGTAVFSPDTRWGNFWAAGISWSIDKESFMTNLTWVDELKIRASVGELGSNSLLNSGGSRNYYGYQPLLALDYNNQNEPGVVRSSLGSPDLRWEKSGHKDIALEFSFFKRLRGSIEYFDKTSTDLIFSVPLPLSAGGTVFGDSQLQNVGSLFNRGFELSLSYDIFKNKNFHWNMTVNASTLKNEFTKLPEGQDVILNGTKQYKVGKGLYDYYIRDWYGVDPSDGSGLFVAADPTATGVRTVDGIAVTPFSNNAKFDYLGSVIGDVFGSVNSSFRYKRFNLDFLFTYQIGGDNLDLNYAGLMDTGAYGGALHTDILNRWRQPGDITAVPRADATLATQWQATSDRFLHDASFFSLRQINFSYDLADSFVKKIGASNVKFIASAENVFNINYRKGFTQQQEFSGNTSNVYIASRIITFGVNLKF